MRPAFLIAWREFAENAKTKGFWLGLLLFPAIITASIQVPIFLEKKGTPTRRFVLVDAGGGFAPLLREQLAADETRRQEEALRDFARDATRQETLAGFIDPTDKQLDLARWRAAQGADWLKVPGFKPPAPRFAESPLPDDIAADAQPDEAARRTIAGLVAGRFEIAYPRRFVAILRTLRALPYPLFFRLITRFVLKDK